MNKKFVGRFTLHGEGHTVDVVGYLNKQVAFMKKLYETGQLTPDKNGRKSLFNTIRDGQVTNSRISTSDITIVLRERLEQFFRHHQYQWTTDEINDAVKQFSSHSMKRGTATTIADRGASDREIVKHGRWTHPTTMAKYVDHSQMKSSVGQKCGFELLNQT